MVMKMKGNLLELPKTLPNSEVFEALVENREVLIERIISSGQETAPGSWYDQSRDEWVVLLQGEATLSYEDTTEVRLKAGDFLLIPAGTRHRVEKTSVTPPCIWLAVHANLA